MSELQGTQPAVSGSSWRSSGGDRFLAAANGTGKQVIVKGYDDEPYLRFLPNSVVEENTALAVQVRERGPLRAAPRSRRRPTRRRRRKWQPVSRDGSYRWFDHRIHLMEKGTPPQVKDESERTKIFDWRRADDRRRAPRWPRRHARVGAGSPRPAPPPLLFVGARRAARPADRRRCALVLMRRRRARPPAAAGGPKPAEEAW